jgi:hypothetical protein
MANDASPKRLRNIVLTTNKFQDRIIFLTFLPSILMFFFFICIIFITNPVISEAVLHVSFLNLQQLIHRFPLLVVFSMCLILFLSMIAAYLISLNMVGAFDRITVELDDIISGRSRKKIDARPEEDLTQDLLKRINVLVENYVEKKT